MPYTKWVFQEALRLYPSAPIVPRLVTKPTRLAGHDLEPGTRVLIDLYNIHRHPDHWPDPERFDPERFSPENSRGRARYAHMPFGGGPHLCVGKQFALLEAQVLLAILSRRFEMRHVPTHPVVNHATITLRPEIRHADDRASQAGEEMTMMERSSGTEQVRKGGRAVSNGDRHSARQGLAGRRALRAGPTGRPLRELLPAGETSRPAAGVLDPIHDLQPGGPTRGGHR